MDKMKVFTRWLRKYHFWVLLVVVAVAGTAGWFLASGDLATAFANNQNDINSAFSKANGIRNEQYHPNAEYIENMDNHIQETRESVYDAWVTKYEKQGDLFVWPDELEPEFLNIVKDLRPFETKVPYPLENELLRTDLCERYNTFIRGELPRLAARIGAEWQAVEGGEDVRGGAPAGVRGEGEEGGSAAGARPTDGVTWNVANQQNIYNRHFDWSNQPYQAPNTLQVLYAQEDLWVLRALMDIIRQVNGGIGQTDPAIPYIEFIRIGKSARLTQTELGGGGDARGGEGPEPGGPAELRQPGVALEGGRGSETAAVTDPADGRYVDMNNVPLSGEQLRGTTGGAVDTEQSTLAVAKRMPVQMRLQIKQTELNRLLIECGNSPMKVEVQKLDFNPSGSGSGRGGAAATTGRGTGNDLSDKDRHYRTIELFGIIAMYNPVNASALGIEEPAGETADQPADDTMGAEDTGSAADGGAGTVPAGDSGAAAAPPTGEASGPAAGTGSAAGAAADDTTDSGEAAAATPAAGAGGGAP